MPREMFGDVVDPSIKVGTKQWYTVPLSILAHAVALGAMVVIPLLATDMLPTPQSVMAFAVAPPPPPPPPSPPPPPDAAPPPPPPPVEVDVNPAAAPVEAPRELKPEPPPVMRTVVGGIQPVAPVQAPVQTMAPPPPPPPPAPVRVGGEIKEPKKVRNVNPVYPKIAQAAKVSGVVILEATISKEGEVRDVKVLRSIPMLDNAAIEAVRQWRYTPTLLNGVPVDIIMTVTVNFTLN